MIVGDEEKLNIILAYPLIFLLVVTIALPNSHTAYKIYLYLRQGDTVFAGVCLFVCLSVCLSTTLHKKL